MRLRSNERAPLALLGFEHRIPIQIIEPAFVQIIGRKAAAILVEIAYAWLIRHACRPHAGLGGQPVAFAEIAAGAGGDDIFPCRRASFRAGNQMVKCQILAGATILAAKMVAQKDIETGKGRESRRFHIGFEGNDRREAYLGARTSNRFIIA
jgi:hypothetical protein